MLKALLLTITVSMLIGCATLAGHEHANLLKQAVRDDQTCQAQGWRYPQPRYVTCRLQIEDQRQYRSWMSLQMMHQTNYQNPTAPPPYPYQQVYRPLDRDHYDCHYLRENGQNHILCGEASRN